MSKYTFTIETEDLEDLEIYQKAHTNSYIVFELKNNFYRRFRSLDGHPEEFYKGVDYTLDELRNLIKDYED